MFVIGAASMKTKRSVIQLASALCAMTLGAHMACASATVKPDTLSVGSDLTLPPYTYFEDHKPSGFDPEFTTAIAKQMNKQVEFVDTRFANLILGVKGARYDIAASAMYVTPERLKVVDFVPYFMTGGSILVKSSAPLKPAAISDLCGMNVASIKGATWLAELSSGSKACEGAGKQPITVKEFDTSPEAAQAVLSGAADAHYEDISIGSRIAERSNGRLMVSSTGPLNPIVCGIYLKKGNTELKSAIESALTTMKANGEYQSLINKYSLAEPTPDAIAKATGTTGQ